MFTKHLNTNKSLFLRLILFVVVILLFLTLFIAGNVIKAQVTSGTTGCTDWSCGTGGCAATERRNCCWYGGTSSCTCNSSSSCSPPPANPPPAGGGSGSGGSPGPTPPSCTATAPATAALQAPLSGSVNLPKPVVFNWVNGVFNRGCPQNNLNRIYYAVRLPGFGCAVQGATYAYTAWFAAGTQWYLDAELQWGTTYCWYVGMSNGSLISNSGIAVFTTAKPPVFAGYANLTTDVCQYQNGVIGRYSATPGRTMNPATFRVVFDNPDPGVNIIDWVALGMVPTTSGQTPSWSSVLPIMQSLKTFIFNISDSYGGRFYSMVDPTNTWSNAPGGATTLNNGYGTATLEGLGTSTRLTVTPTQTIADFSIRFNDTFPSGTYGLYAMALTRNPATAGTNPGFLVSNDAAPNTMYTMVRVGIIQVDVVNPVVTISNPSANAGRYNVTWTISDNLNNQLARTYISSDVAGAQLQASGGPLITTTGAPPTIPTDPSNTGLGGSQMNIGQQYTIVSAEDFPSYTFTGYAADRACNETTGTNILATPSPWIVADGNISGLGGIARNNIPIITDFTLPIYYRNPTTVSYLSNGSTIGGTAIPPRGRASLLNSYALSYLDDAIKSPNTQNGLWYDYLLDLIKKNGRTVNTLSSRTINTPMSTGLATPTDSKINVEITGDLTIESNTVCNVTAVVFVQGNLTINPDLTVISRNNLTPLKQDQPYNGCMFLVKGNVLVNGGANKTPAVRIADPSKASYDIVDALIITDGTFTAIKDSGQSENGLAYWIYESTSGSSARTGYGAVLIGTKVYYYSGGPTGGSYSNTMQIYDLVTKTWTSVTGAATARLYTAAATDGSRAYYWGGGTAAGVSATMDIYNPAINTWTVGASGPGSPVGRTGAFSAYSNGKIYIWAGFTGTAYVNTMNIYDIATNTWSAGASGGTAKGLGGQGVVYNNKIYFVGGCITNGSCSAVTNTVNIYDIASNTWSTGAPLPVAKGLAGSTIHNGLLFTAGGFNGTSYVATTHTYNFATNTWTLGSPLQTVKGGFTSISDGQRVYAWGGRNNTTSFLDDIQTYTSPSVANKLDGLYMGGGLVAQSTMNGSASTLKRDVNGAANNFQPAIVFRTDPRYRLMFGDDFATRTYDIREYGL